MAVSASSSHIRANINQFISEASFWVPEAFLTSAWIGHAPFAFWLAECLRPSTFVELGAYYGYSYLAFNQAFKRLGTKTRSFAIDTWKGDEHAGFYGDEVFERLNTYNLQHYADFSELIKSTFDDAVDLFEDGSIDLLHLDGRHFYEDVKHDFIAWKRKLSKRGVVLLHDTNVTARGFGVFQLWEELKGQYPHFEFLTEHGLGILGVGSSLPGGLEELFAASGDEELARQIRDAYGRLGQDIENRVALTRAIEDRNRLALEIGRENSSRQEVDAAYHKCQQRVRELSDELTRFQEITAQYDKLHSEHQALRLVHNRSVDSLREIESARQQLEKDNETLRRTQLVVDAESQVVRQDNESLRNELEQSKSTVVHLRNLISQGQELLSQERKNLALILSSTSWRLTRPIRWISERLPSTRKARALAAIPWWLISFQLPAKMRYRQLKKKVLASGLFDAEYYLKQNADVAESGVNPLDHFLTYGGTEGRSPHLFFDNRWYVSQNPDVGAAGINALVHYLQHGGAEGRNPHPLFDSAYYLEQIDQSIPAGITPLAHFLKESRVRDKSTLPLFDIDWYRSQYTELRDSGVPSLIHYLTQPFDQRKSPHPLFDRNFYLEQNADLLNKDIDLLEHYLSPDRRGDPHPLFDSSYYLKLHPEIVATNICPLSHYLRSGGSAAVAPHPDFDATFYRTSYSALLTPGVDPLTHYLTSGVELKTNPSSRFDTAWYLSEYVDVALQKINPLVHYVRWGRSEGRRPLPSLTLSPTVRTTRFRIVFISGEADTPGHYYRVTNLAACLAPRFFETIILKISELPDRLSEVSGAAVVWIWRATWSDQIEAVVRRAREGNARLVFDVDDLMFRPELANVGVIDGIRSMKLTEDQAKRHFTDAQKVFICADYCSVPTFSLAAEAGDFNMPSVVIPNGFDHRALSVARTARSMRKQLASDGIVRIGYASGSFTHQRDLAVASLGLARVLTEAPYARLVLFRKCVDLEEFPELKKVQDQIEWRDLVPIDRLLMEYARFDINIAPLEVGNRFCEAKSELKFFEAALVGVPTVASPTRPFVGAIRHGETGFLVNGSDEWHAALLSLCRDVELRRRMADTAFNEVLWRYGPERRSVLVTRFANRLIGPPSIGSDLFVLGLEGENATSIPSADVPEFDVVFQSERRGDSRVSVIIPLFNYAQLVTEALESVRNQTVRGIDLIVVDDRSTDDSLAIVRSWMERNASDFNRVALLQNRHNSKLGRTRNAAVSFADTELFLPLDPDNLLLPECVAKCVEHLDDSGAAFAYPTTQCFGERTNLIGCDEYDPALLQRGNFIDAMAMVRKAHWIAVGGYSNLDPMGWEDYDFWCKFAERGFFGIRVPDVIAKYRAHNRSMLKTITTVAENMPLVVKDLSTRHPWVNLHLPVAGEETSELSNGISSGAAPISWENELDKLLPLLRCPETGETLLKHNAETLRTESGSREWPIVAGRPVFTAEGRNIVLQAETHTSNPLSEEAIRMIQEADGPVLNLSAGGTVTRHPNVVELEYTLFRHTTLAGDVHRLPFRDGIFDAVVCFNAFEHYREPDAAMDEVRRVLKPGGKFLMRTAFLQPLHEAPHHYYNCTEYGLRQWLRNFHIERVSVSENFNPVYALSWLCSEVENGFAYGVSPEAAAVVRNASLSQFVEFWRQPNSRSSPLWEMFYRLPLDTQAKLAAGWEALSSK